eukprot:1053692-Prorocentrum_minimum.AAC.1
MARFYVKETKRVLQKDSELTFGIMLQATAAVDFFWRDEVLERIKDCPSFFSHCSGVWGGQVNLAQRLGCMRGGLTDVKSHAWFRGFDWKALEGRAMKPPWIPPLSSVEDVSNIDPVDQDTPHPGLGASRVRRPSLGKFDHW